MNKYQEALEFLCDNSKLTQFNIGQSQWASETLQELVDKETPKKPLPPKDTFFLHQCPNCKVDFIGSSIDRCQCGQKIGWNEE